MHSFIIIITQAFKVKINHQENYTSYLSVIQSISNIPAKFRENLASGIFRDHLNLFTILGYLEN